jgi:hypothetical protein
VGSHAPTFVCFVCTHAGSGGFLFAGSKSSVEDGQGGLDGTLLNTFSPLPPLPAKCRAGRGVAKCRAG